MTGVMLKAKYDYKSEWMYVEPVLLELALTAPFRLGSLNRKNKNC